MSILSAYREHHKQAAENASTGTAKRSRFMEALQRNNEATEDCTSTIHRLCDLIDEWHNRESQ
jgi:hypothetical protein